MQLLRITYLSVHITMQCSTFELFAIGSVKVRRFLLYYGRFGFLRFPGGGKICGAEALPSSHDKESDTSNYLAMLWRGPQHAACPPRPLLDRAADTAPVYLCY